MTRFLSAAGLAVYVLAVSTAFPSVKEAGADLGLLAPAVAAEASTGSEPATPGARAAETVEPAEVASAGEKEWDADRDGMLMEETASSEPFAVLDAL